MQTITGKSFNNFSDFPKLLSSKGNEFADCELVECKFIHCHLSLAKKAHKRTIVRNVFLRRCMQESCEVTRAILENVLVDDLRCFNPLIVSGAAFNAVEFRGYIGPIRIIPKDLLIPLSASQQRAFDEANARYYEQVEWALDIRDAIFVDARISNIPPSLIRRDPETQMILADPTEWNSNWRSIDLWGMPFYFTIDEFLTRGTRDMLLIACKAAPNFEDQLRCLRQLREAGVAT